MPGRLRSINREDNLNPFKYIREEDDVRQLKHIRGLTGLFAASYGLLGGITLGEIVHVQETKSRIALIGATALNVTVSFVSAKISHKSNQRISELSSNDTDSFVTGLSSTSDENISTSSDDDSSSVYSKTMTVPGEEVKGAEKDYYDASTPEEEVQFTAGLDKIRRTEREA